MPYDQYGRPYGSPTNQYFANQPPATGADIQPQNYQTQAKIHMPSVNQMGGQGSVPWVRYPFFPTAPFYSTNPRVGYQTRYYGATLLSTDADYTANTEAIRTVQFDIPCRLIAINAAAINTAGSLGAGLNGLDTFLFRLEYTTGDRLVTTARLGSTICGTAESPGELGGTGMTIDQGASIVLGLTPLANAPAAHRVDITLVCLEMRGASNFTGA